MSNPNRHMLYLTDTVWGELKHRAFIESQTAGELIGYLLEQALNNPDLLPPNLPRYQERLSRDVLERRKPRTVRGVPQDVWEKSEQAAKTTTPPHSISGRAEFLLRSYLGLPRLDEFVDDDLPYEEEFPPEENPRSTKGALTKDDHGNVLLSTGKTVYNLGQNPGEIDLMGNDLSRKPINRPPEE